MIMIKSILRCLCLYIILLQNFDGLASINGTAKDSLSKRESRKQFRKEWRQDVHALNRRFFFRCNLIYANLETRLSFHVLGNFLTASIGIEEDLGFPDKSLLVSGSFLGRITPRSGIYAEYYGLNRSVNYLAERDIIFLKDTIPAGTTGGAFFNTRMFSAGYIFSVMKSPDSFLGIYLNALLMKLSTGMHIDYQDYNEESVAVLPNPTFGLLMAFRITDDLTFNGSVGFFAFRNNALDESLYHFNISLNYRPVSWLGLSLSYQEFDIKVIFPEENVDVQVDYNYSGPSFGIDFSF